MKTPICDFVSRYAEAKTVRMHMPGHKGLSRLGPEAMDITEISGADSLYEASGIIAESERRTATLFGTKMTLYSTEGSSQCIRGMLALVQLHMAKMQTNSYVLAARNLHKTFVTAAGLLDIEVRFLVPDNEATTLYAPVSLPALEEIFKKEPPAALYVTSPDYLGNIAPIETISALCHRYGVLLLVDNAHGAYLRFLSPSRHPINLGADLCCDSAHKTLPALTGAAYLHLAEGLPSYFYETARDAMAMFGSTSPSYLILQSLDLLTESLKDEFPAKLAAFADAANAFKMRLKAHGFCLMGDEPLKLTVLPKAFGYTATALAAHLRKNNIECEFSDEDSLVLMLSPYMETDVLTHTADVLCSLPRKKPIQKAAPKPHVPARFCSVREAMLAPNECVPLSEAKGRVLSSLSVSCPPAVPPVICGETVDESVLEILSYYGITECRVMIERKEIHYDLVTEKK